MVKNGPKFSRKAKIRAPEVISFGPLGRPSIRGRVNARFMAAGSAFLVAAIFLLVALIQPLSPDGVEARLGTSIALAETLNVGADLPPDVQIVAAETRAVSDSIEDVPIEEVTREEVPLEEVPLGEVAGDEFELAALGGAAQSVLVRRSVTVKRGGTLMRTLIDAGTERRQAHLAIAALAKVFNPRRLQVGQEILITLQPTESGEDRLLSVTLQVDNSSMVYHFKTELFY